MQINVRQNSKSRILLNMINNYQKSPEELNKLEQAKQNSITKIEKKFCSSETNKTYKFPRTEEIVEEEIITESPLLKQTKEPQIKNKVLQNLMDKIYQSNSKKKEQPTSSVQHSDFIKKQYSIIMSSKQTAKKSNKMKTENSLIKKSVLNISSQKQLSKNQSRGLSPESKLQYSNRSINGQQDKFLQQKKNNYLVLDQKMHLYHSFRSVEPKQNNKSQNQLLQNKSLDFPKQLLTVKKK